MSRSHAILRVDNGKFYLADTKSKFGTLWMVRKPLELKPNRSVSVQAGRSKLSFTVSHCGPAYLEPNKKWNRREQTEEEQKWVPSIAELQLEPGEEFDAGKKVLTTEEVRRISSPL